MDDPDGDADDLALASIFTEPPRPPSPEATFSTYTRAQQHRSDSEQDSSSTSWTDIRVRLVGAHPLWGHYLWNAARAFATFLDAHTHLYQGKVVLELGAGGGLPGLVTVLNGARKTVLTDYPDKGLVDNLLYNVQHNVPVERQANVDVCGYIWGRPVASLHAAAPGGFDLIILSDLIFNHSQHDALLDTCDRLLRRLDAPAEGGDKPAVLVFYTHHRPRLASRDLEFFTKAGTRGWTCEEIVTERYPPMFPDDPGEEDVRSTVHGWTLTRSN